MIFAVLIPFLNKDFIHYYFSAIATMLIYKRSSSAKMTWWILHHLGTMRSDIDPRASTVFHPQLPNVLRSISPSLPLHCTSYPISCPSFASGPRQNTTASLAKPSQAQPKTQKAWLDEACLAWPCFLGNLGHKSASFPCTHVRDHGDHFKGVGLKNLAKTSWSADARLDAFRYFQVIKFIHYLCHLKP